MKIEEKLNHFTSITLDNTREKCNKELEEHKNKLEEHFEKHKEEALKNARLEEQIEINGIKRHYSKEFTTEQLHIRRKINLKQIELQDKLFKEVADLFNIYFQGENYKKLLIKLIKDAKEVAKEEEILVYIDKNDIELKDELEKETGVKIYDDGRSFMGGIVAEIPSKNILIDDSFETKILHYRDHYLITF